jgi:hypothetical protein
MATGVVANVTLEPGEIEAARKRVGDVSRQIEKDLEELRDRVIKKSNGFLVPVPVPVPVIILLAGLVGLYLETPIKICF